MEITLAACLLIILASFIGYAISTMALMRAQRTLIAELKKLVAVKDEQIAATQRLADGRFGLIQTLKNHLPGNVVKTLAENDF